MYRQFLDLENYSVQRLLALLVLAALVVRLPLISYAPFVADETFYAIMFVEQAQHYGFIQTLFGYPAFFKGFLFFSVYAFLSSILNWLPLDVETIYRLPTHLFGIINICLVFLITRSLVKKNTFSFLLALAYSFIFLVVYISNTVLSDTMLSTFILSSVYAYMSSGTNSRLYLLAGLLAACAYFVKLIVAFAIPFLAVAYLYFNNKKELCNPLFLASLAFIPAAMLLHYFFYAPLLSGELSGGFGYEIFNRLNPSDIYEKIMGTSDFFIYCNLWLVFSIAGFAKHWKQNPFVACWFLLAVPLILSNVFLTWYYLPIMLPMAYFSLMFLSYDGKKGEFLFDKFFCLSFILFIVASFSIGFYAYGWIPENYNDLKEAGKFLAFRENVHVIGFNPQTTVAYKLLEERKASRDIDFGYTFIGVNSTNPRQFALLAQNYAYIESNLSIYQGSFSRIYWQNGIFRKDTAIKELDYVALTNIDEPYYAGLLSLEEDGSAYSLSIDGEVVFRNRHAIVYKLRKHG